jgi:outer membrane protein assembly factor BamB
VADDTGGLSAYDVVGGDLVWTAGTTGVRALGVSGDVLVARTEDAVQAFDLTDGERLWSTRIPFGGAGDLVADLGGVVAVASAEGTVGLDPATGRERWRADGAAESLVRAGRLFLLDDRRLSVLDEDGDRERDWTLSGLVGDTVRLTPTTDGVLVTDVGGGAVEVSP